MPGHSGWRAVQGWTLGSGGREGTHRHSRDGGPGTINVWPPNSMGEMEMAISMNSSQSQGSFDDFP